MLPMLRDPREDAPDPAPTNPTGNGTSKGPGSEGPRFLKSHGRAVTQTVYVLMHGLPLLGFWTGFGWTEVLVGLGLFWLRLFGVTAGYHRYFSHRTFKTSRAFQLFLAVLAQSTGQKGVLWWSAHHRHHHRNSDLEDDVHSPVRRSFWYSHVGWIFDPRNDATDLHRVKDLAKYPELVWLEKFHWVPPTALGVLVFVTLGWSGLWVAFFGSTILLYHATYTINSLSHVFGSRRYDTVDDSRNNLWLALLTLGEGWHNNHHHHMASCRQGFYRWEVDLTYCAIKALERVGLVWDVNEPTPRVFDPERHMETQPSWKHWFFPPREAPTGLAPCRRSDGASKAGAAATDVEPPRTPAA